MKYEKIINLEHYEPKNHPRMSREARAAQFSPYAALSGFDKVIEHTEKISELKNRRIVISQYLDSDF